MHKMLINFPTRMETERLALRPYQAGDGQWYYPMSQRNKDHLSRFEIDNPVRFLNSEEEAEILMRQMAADWAGRNHFFMGAFEKATGDFVAQIYIGPVAWELPEFAVGYFADCAHEGQGFVTEAVRGVLKMLFEDIRAHRVRLECDDTNTRSIRVAERCGFVREGHLRQNHRRDADLITGTLYYGLLREEYESAR